MASFRRWVAAAVIGGMAVLASPASSSTYGEVGDAPDLPPGQFTMGVGPLERIHGVISDSTDVDIYYVNIVNAAAFSATVVGGAAYDTQLFLFMGSGFCPISNCPFPGTGLVHDDDTPPGGIYQSTITGSSLPGNTVYALAISAFDRDPVSGGGLIWSGDPVNAQYPPNGPGAAGACTGWTSFGEYSGEYWITLTGCESVDPGPQPASWNELADAPNFLPGQQTSGEGSVQRIFGTLSSGDDVDTYCIRITNSATFSAATSGPVDGDTQLSLFAPGGNGIVFNDDDAGTMFSRVSGAFVSNPGTYYLSVSEFERSATGIGGARIWGRIPVNVERPPDDLGAPGPLSGWTNTGTDGGYYGIRLTGAQFCAGTTGVPAATSPTTARLEIQPNPFTAATTISYSIPHAGPARLRVFDIGGRLIRTLVHEARSSGEHSIRWDGRDSNGRRVPVGIYSIQLESTQAALSQRAPTRRVILMR